jgi:hypothetical protein
MSGDDVHLVGMGCAEFGAIDHFARSVGGGLHVQRAQLFIGLLHRIGVDAGWDAMTARLAAALCQSSIAAAATSRIRRRRLVFVFDAVGGAAIAFQLCLDPVDRVAIPVRALTAVAELSQSLDGCLVFFEFQSADQRLDGVVLSLQRNNHSAQR